LTEDVNQSAMSQKIPPQNYYLMLTVAYYNLGVEYEFIGDVNEAIHAITEALTVAKSHLG